MDIEKQKSRIGITRHLNDIDDLKTYGRDPELIPGQEGEARAIAEDIVRETRLEHKDAILIVCSDKKRGTQTTSLITEQIRDIDSNLRVKIVPDSNLSGIYQ